MIIFFDRLKRFFEGPRHYPFSARVRWSQPGARWSQPNVETFLNRFMEQHKPYLLSRYSLYQLSADTGITISDLLAIIGKEKEPDFKAFINHHRILYCQQLLKRMPPEKICLFDLSIICGFTDQCEFSSSFKRVLRVSFSNYIKKMYHSKPPIHSSE